MAVTTEKDLSPNSKSLWLKATSALETRNYGYAVSLIQAILKESPAFLIGRQWLRRAEIAATKGGKGSMLSGSSLQVMKSQGLVKKDPKAAMVAAEEILEKEPHNVAANGLLKDAALAAGMPEVAGFALETMRDADPKNTKIMHELARHYVSVDDPTKAIDVYNAIVALNPADIEATKGGKDAAARASMRSGNWDQVGKEGVDYRNMLKNKEEAVSLEQQNRLIKSADVIDQQLAELSAAYEENPNNLDVVRKIADLHEKKDDVEGALQYYQWAVEITKGGRSRAGAQGQRSGDEEHRDADQHPREMVGRLPRCACRSRARRGRAGQHCPSRTRSRGFSGPARGDAHRHGPQTGRTQPDRLVISVRVGRTTHQGGTHHGGDQRTAKGAEQPKTWVCARSTCWRSVTR